MLDVIELKADNRKIFLIGTAHVSKQSAELVRETIEKVKPDVVAVELCEQRKQALIDGKRWNETEITEVIRNEKTYLFLLQILLANFQRKIGDRVGVKPGLEMIEAIKIAKDKDIPIALIDRDIGITLKRAMSQISFIEKAKLILGFFSGIFDDDIDEEAIERLKDKDIISEMMEELSKEIPSVKKVLIDERNEYLAQKILSLDAKKVVAVVGAGHVEGITEILKEPKDVDMKDLETVKKSRSMLKYLAYSIPAIFVAIVVWSLFRHNFTFTADILLKWFLINGSLSALGVILARGHPLTIISAFLAAPFTSLNPAIAAGWVAGLVELKVRKPRVMDFTGLLGLNGMRDYWKNRITKIFLVIVFANIGSSIGTFIALPYLASLI